MKFYVMIVYCFFFFKQKTAYEMRISDWSSDVCSSDLAIVFWGEDKVRRRMSWGELRAAVARLAAALKADGVGPGDRVAAYMPNLPETEIGRASCRERVCQYV